MQSWRWTCMPWKLFFSHFDEHATCEQQCVIELVKGKCVNHCKAWLTPSHLLDQLSLMLTQLQVDISHTLKVFQVTWISLRFCLWFVQSLLTSPYFETRCTYSCICSGRRLARHAQRRLCIVRCHSITIASYNTDSWFMWNSCTYNLC